MRSATIGQPVFWRCWMVISKIPMVCDLTYFLSLLLFQGIVKQGIRSNKRPDLIKQLAANDLGFHGQHIFSGLPIRRLGLVALRQLSAKALGCLPLLKHRQKLASFIASLQFVISTKERTWCSMRQDPSSFAYVLHGCINIARGRMPEPTTGNRSDPLSFAGDLDKFL